MGQNACYFYENVMKSRQHFKSRKFAISLLFIVLNAHSYIIHTQVVSNDQLMYH